MLVWLTGAPGCSFFWSDGGSSRTGKRGRSSFSPNVTTTVHTSDPTKTAETFVSTLPFPWNEFVELKARFSTLGWPYVCWYLGLPVLFLFFLRPTQLFGIALFLLIVWLGVIQLKTSVVATYVVNVTLALPICLMFALPNRRGNQLGGAAWPLLVASLILITAMHAWLVLRPATRTNDWLTTEQELGQAFRTLPPHSIIWGDPAEAMVPAWKEGDTYYMRKGNFLSNVPGARERLAALAAASTDYRLELVDNHWIAQKNQ